MTTSRFSLIAALALAGCATQPVFVYPELPVPPEPPLPKIPAAELVCLSDDAYEALVVRDATRKAYADRLRAIIAAHNAQARPAE